MSNNLPIKDFIVVNASPLITLFTSGLEQILPGMFNKIVIPDAVWEEVTICDDKACKGISEATWAIPEEVLFNNRILVWNLGKGESAVLSWALKYSDYIALE